MEFISDACASIKSMVDSSPAGAGEVDGVQISGYMDGVRVVRRLKKKLDSEVELYCGEGANGGVACAGVDMHAQLTSSYGPVDDAQE